MNKRRLSIRAHRRHRRVPINVILDDDPLTLSQKGTPGEVDGTVRAKLKLSNPGKPWAIANEFICAEIGRYLRLPVPPFAIAECDDEESTEVFASLRFDFDGRDPLPFRPEALVAALPELAAGILVFDIFIANSDRHQSNIEVNDDLNPSVVKIFDHDIALLGNRANGGIPRLKKLTRRLGVTDGPFTDGFRHVLIDHVRTTKDFIPWLAKIGMISSPWIDGVCYEAKQYGLTEEECQVVGHFLRNRAWSLPSIINNNRQSFSQIANWVTV